MATFQIYISVYIYIYTEPNTLNPMVYDSQQVMFIKA